MGKPDNLEASKSATDEKNLTFLFKSAVEFVLFFFASFASNCSETYYTNKGNLHAIL